MGRHTRSLAAVVAAAVALAATAVAGAQTGPSNPGPPPSTPISPPPLPVPKSGPGFGFGPLGYPFDFHFVTQVYGYNFKPGETVRVEVQGLPSSPATGTADGSGNVTVPLDFRWIFCGPHASRQPPPSIAVTGSSGYSERVSLSAYDCPTLVSAQRFGGSPQPGAGGGGGVATGSAVSGPASTSVAVGPISNEPTAAPRFTPEPVPTAGPSLALFHIDGFGFAPGERVTLQGKLGDRTGPPASTTADAQGRLSVSLQTYVPGHCSSGGSAPEVTATGDEGTAVTSRLQWRDLIMSPCFAPPNDDGQPPPPGIPVPPGPAATPAAPSPAGGTATAGTDAASVILYPAIAHPGKGERAVVTSRRSGLSVTLTVRYPRSGSTRALGRTGGDGRAVLRWIVPKRAGHGLAHGLVTVGPGSLTLQLKLRVR